MTETHVKTDRVPIYGPEFAEAPERVYARLREYGELAPVELAPGVPATLVIGYDAALEVLRDPATFPKDARRWQAGVPADCPVLPVMMWRENCQAADGPAHTRLRSPVVDGLNRLDPSALRENVERNADLIIDGFAADGEVELMSGYARTLPTLVMLEMFGCPPDLGERMRIGFSGIIEGVDAEASNALLGGAIMELVALKREKPGADVTSWMLSHSSELTDEEMLHQLVTLLGAGIEPEQSLIANGVRLLLSDDRFGGDLSGGSLPVEDALDEILWTDPPLANMGITYPRQDVEFRGRLLPADQPVVISYAAANTDPSRAAAGWAGNRAHLAFNAGPHTCPAKSQARLIASVAIEKLLDRLPEMELAVPVDELRWRPGPFQRALTALPVRFPPEPPRR
ncbi:cytochrome P450 [Actinomadura sp. LD22]|uniref:Cytochrome P450 n=1 Tax=Actinomadura physcomitrii TaxID=2650748 RepID=A0A6I4M8A5_9ACTN|nr:cytochrome P450 [Actinomadura physcomitrii]MWA00625.1 cytochrome P450 [Actinomadura physcomitrii]